MKALQTAQEAHLGPGDTNQEAFCCLQIPTAWGHMWMLPQTQTQALLESSENCFVLMYLNLQLPSRKQSVCDAGQSLYVLLLSKLKIFQITPVILRVPWNTLILANTKRKNCDTFEKLQATMNIFNCLLTLL